MTDSSNEQREPLAGGFVRRLIPTVAVATVSLTACSSSGGSIQKETNNDTNNATNNGTNGATNNGTNGAANNGTNGATNNGTNGATNNGTNGATNNSSGTNNMPGTNNVVSVDGDGSMSASEWRAFCEAMNECDPEYLQDNFASVEDCATSFMDDSAEAYLDYEETYGLDCAVTSAALEECLFGGVACLDGEFITAPGEYEACADRFGEAFDMQCSDE